LDNCGALKLDHRLLDIGVDAAEETGQQVLAHHLTLRARWNAAVVALVERAHRRAHRFQQILAVEGLVAHNHRAPAFA
jgi:hypothetical protein